MAAIEPPQFSLALEVRKSWCRVTKCLLTGTDALVQQGFSQDSILYHRKSEYQDILVFRSAHYGTNLSWSFCKRTNHMLSYLFVGKVFVIDGILRKSQETIDFDLFG